MDKVKISSILIVLALVGVGTLGMLETDQSKAANEHTVVVTVGKTYTSSSMDGYLILITSAGYVSFNCNPSTWNGLTFSEFDETPVAGGLRWTGTPAVSGAITLTVTLDSTVYTVRMIAAYSDTITLHAGTNYNSYKTYGAPTPISSADSSVTPASWNGLTFTAESDVARDMYKLTYSGTPTNTGSTNLLASYDGGEYYYYIKVVVSNPVYTATINVNDNSYGSVSQSQITDINPGTAITVNGNQLTIGDTTVTATPAATTSEHYYTFVGWSNADGTMTANRTITANFMQNNVGPALPESYSVRLSIGQTWSYTPTATPPSATLSISGNATSWITLSNGTVSGTVPNVDVLTTYQLNITATTTNPTQTAMQTITFTVVPGLEGSASPNTLYLYSGGPIPNTASETISLTYDGFGNGTYTWSMVDDGGIGMTVSANGELGGICVVAPTANPITVTVRITGTVSGYTQTDDVTFNVVVVAKLVFTSNPLTDAVIS